MASSININAATTTLNVSTSASVVAELPKEQFIGKMMEILRDSKNGARPEFLAEQVLNLIQQNPNLANELKLPNDSSFVKMKIVDKWINLQTSDPQQKNIEVSFVVDVLGKKQLGKIVENKVDLTSLSEDLKTKLKETAVEKIITQGLYKGQTDDTIASKIFLKLPRNDRTDKNRAEIIDYVAMSREQIILKKATDISEKGKEFIKSYEALKTELYDNDGAKVGNTTIGYGHLVHYGKIDNTTSEEEFKNGITKERAEELFNSDVKKFVDAVNKYVKKPLTQNQFDALVSFAYNIGNRNDKKQTGFFYSKVLELVNGGCKNMDKIIKAFGSINTSGGIPVTGLTLRRKDEAEMFLSSDYQRTKKKI